MPNGGISPGGLNFDAKVRRPSKDPVDLMYGHILGMDSYAKGLKIADKMLKDKVFEDFIDKRYDSYNKGIGQRIKNNDEDFVSLEKHVLDKEDEIITSSGRQEMLKSILNQYILKSD